MLSDEDQRAIEQVVIADNLMLMKLCIYWNLNDRWDLLAIAQQEVEDRAALN